jgi:hypothetical protein
MMHTAVRAAGLSRACTPALHLHCSLSGTRALLLKTVVHVRLTNPPYQYTVPGKRTYKKEDTPLVLLLLFV